jgi:GNAT superfamily N-acetyltransferase
MADVSVRPARADDVGDIARIQVDTWRFAYQGVLPGAVLDALTVEAATAAWSDAVGAPPSPRHHVLVALEGTWRVGFVATAPDDDDDGGGSDGEGPPTIAIGPIVVEPRWGRRGHASRLLAAAVDTAVADGMRRAVAWVPEADQRIQDFFSSAGWEPDGMVRGLDTGAGELREIRLHAALD